MLNSDNVHAYIYKSKKISKIISAPVSALKRVANDCGTIIDNLIKAARSVAYLPDPTILEEHL